MAKALLRMRRYVIVLKTKADHDDDSKWSGFYKTRTAKAMENERHTRILLEPRYSQHAIEGYGMLERAWRQGGWTVVLDEGWYSERLGLEPYTDRLLTQGRSKNISVVFGQQRPVTTSRFVISQATHVLCFRVEGRDVKTMAEATSPRIADVLEDLRKRQFAYFNRAERWVGSGTANQLSALLVPAGSQRSVTKPLDTHAG
jgi:hypothetical protein